MRIQTVLSKPECLLDVAVYGSASDPVIYFPHAEHGWPKCARFSPEDAEIIQGAWDGVTDMSNCRLLESCDSNGLPVKNKVYLVLDLNSNNIGLVLGGTNA